MIQEQNCPTLGSAPFLLFKYSGLCKPVTPAGLMASWVSRGNCWPLWQPAPRSGCRVWSFTRFEHLSAHHFQEGFWGGLHPVGTSPVFSMLFVVSEDWSQVTCAAQGAGLIQITYFVAQEAWTKYLRPVSLWSFPSYSWLSFSASVKPLKLDTNFL